MYPKMKSPWLVDVVLAIPSGKKNPVQPVERAWVEDKRVNNGDPWRMSRSNVCLLASPNNAVENSIKSTLGLC